MRLPFSLALVCISWASYAQSKSELAAIELGSRNSRPGEGLIQGLPGSQFALFVKNRKAAALGNIQTASFYLAKDGLPQRPFRVRIYQASADTGSPGADLLPQAVMVSAPCGGQWFTVDLTAYAIQAPPAGFVVAMEWVVDQAKVNSAPSLDDHILCPTFEFKESLTWTYTIGKGWSQLTLSNSEGRRYNAMIKATVAPGK
ncbi:MAG: hypothetical protein JWR44_732 [Hymenobacter sp.]|nr:hypothetical protein [Hymenobacter sp.]